MIKDRSQAMPYAIWACYLQPAAKREFPAVQGVMYKNY